MVDLGKIRDLLQEQLFTTLTDDDERYDELSNEVVKPALKAVCNIFGHDIIMDHCCKPEHDFCITCHEQIPGQAKNRQK